RLFLKGILPEYMIPSSFIVLEALPKTPSGKIDRRALTPSGSLMKSMQAVNTLPITATQRLVAKIWSEVLRRPDLGINEDFFELGGHSLLATQILSRLRAGLGLDVPMQLLFDNRTILLLSGAIDAFGGSYRHYAAPEIRAFPPEAMAPLSLSQRRLWFLDQLEPGSPVYHVSLALRLTGELQAEAL